MISLSKRVANNNRPASHNVTLHVPVGLLWDRAFDTDQALDDDGADAGPELTDVHPRGRQPGSVVTSIQRGGRREGRCDAS